MLFTPATISAIEPRSYPFFLTEDGATGFAVKVLMSGARSFYFRRKSEGKRADVPLGNDLDTARQRYAEMVKREATLRARHRAALEFATVAVNIGPVRPAVHEVGHEEVTNPLLYRSVTLDLLVKRYIAGHVVPNLRPTTARGYISFLDKVLRELGGSPILSGRISVDDARQALKAYINAIGQSTPTQANRIRAVLSSCFTWGVYEDLCHATPMVGIRCFKEKPKSRRLSQVELPRFLSVLQQGEYNVNTAACLLLILATGLRASEALRIRVGDIDLSGGKLTIPDTKNGSPFLVPLVPLTAGILGACMDGHPEGRPLFNTSIFGLRQVARRVCKKAGITPCSTHDLRRTFGTLLGELGVSVPVISRCLNHSVAGSVTTRCYALHDMMGEKREALQKVADALVALGCKDSPSPLLMLNQKVENEGSTASPAQISLAPVVCDTEDAARRTEAVCRRAVPHY